MIGGALAIDSMVSCGCIVSGSTIRRPLLFSKVRVNSYCKIVEVPWESTCLVDHFCGNAAPSALMVEAARAVPTRGTSRRSSRLVNPAMLIAKDGPLYKDAL